MKRLLASITLILTIILLLEFRYFCSDGFRADKVIYRKPYNPEFEKLQCESVDDILGQEFKYLGKGRQVYVFESADKNYVIKLIRCHKYQRPYWTYFFENNRKVQKALSDQRCRYNRAMSSYQIAADELKHDTEVVFVHLNKTSNLDKKLIVKDRLHRKIAVDLDSTAFIVQKKINSFEELFYKCLKENEQDKAIKMIESFIDRVAERTARGIYNRDPKNSVRNAGIINDKYVDIDIGSYYIPLIRKSKEDFKTEILLFTKDLRDFLEKNDKEYLKYYDLKIENIINNQNNSL